MSTHVCTPRTPVPYRPPDRAIEQEVLLSTDMPDRLGQLLVGVGVVDLLPLEL